MKAKNIVLWVIQILVAAMFLIAGGSKLTGVPAMVQMYDAIGWGQWFRYVTGVIEVGGAILVLIPGIEGIGALLLGCTMIGAIITHLTVLHVPFPTPLALLAGSLGNFVGPLAANLAAFGLANARLTALTACEKIANYKRSREDREVS